MEMLISAIGLDGITINKRRKNKAQDWAQEYLTSRGLQEEKNPTKTTCIFFPLSVCLYKHDFSFSS